MRDMTPSCEASLKGASGINGIRKLAETKPETKIEIVECVRKSKEILETETIFQQLSIKLQPCNQSSN